MPQYSGLLKHVTQGNACHEYRQQQGNDALAGNFGPCPASQDITIPAQTVTGMNTLVTRKKKKKKCEKR